LSQKSPGGKPNSGSVEKELQMSHQKIKALRNSLRSLVEPEDNKYTIIEPNQTSKDSEPTKATTQPTSNHQGTGGAAA
jgi:hypothetical protein